MTINKDRYTIPNMKAHLVLHSKDMDEDGNIVEMTVWKVPVTQDKPYGFKYSLVYITNGERVVGYDNSESKGDHRHIRDKELPYRFKGIRQLLKDFYRDIKNIKEGKL